MDSTVLDHITAAAVVVYALQAAKTLPGLAALFDRVPLDNRTIYRIVSAVGAFVTAVGIHVATTGDATAGWHLAITVPPLGVLLHAGWDWVQQFALNQVTYDAVAQKAGTVLPTAPTILLPSSLPGGH